MSETWERELERAQADGRVTVHDADEVSNFASFLAESAGLPQSGGTSEQVWARRIAYARHYPDDFKAGFPALYDETVARMALAAPTPEGGDHDDAE